MPASDRTDRLKLINLRMGGSMAASVVVGTRRIHCGNLGRLQDLAKMMYAEGDNLEIVLNLFAEQVGSRCCSRQWA